MADTLIIDKNLSTAEKYDLIIRQLEHLLDNEDHWLTNLSNFTAIIKQTFEKVSWAGFYLFDGTKLFLGPFQGKIACTRIELGKGVCGTAAQNREIIIVPNVEDFPGHIACDSESKSEIVIPLFIENKLIGVLDLDSTELNTFNESDAKYLSLLCDILIKKSPGLNRI